MAAGEALRLRQQDRPGAGKLLLDRRMRAFEHDRTRMISRIVPG